jgi:hypothetical protein
MSGPVIPHTHLQQFLKVFGTPSSAIANPPPSANGRDTLPTPLPVAPQSMVHLEERVVVDAFFDKTSAADHNEASGSLNDRVKPELIGLPKPTPEIQSRLLSAGFSGSSDFDQVRTANLHQADNGRKAYAERQDRPSSSSPRIQLSLTHRSTPDAEMHGIESSSSVHGLQEDITSKRVQGVKQIMALDSASRNPIAEMGATAGTTFPAFRSISEISQLALAFGLLANADLHKRWPVAYFDPRVVEKSRIRSLFRKPEEGKKSDGSNKGEAKGLRSGRMIGISGPIRRIFERLRQTKLARGKKTAVMLAVSSYAAILDVIAHELVDAFSGKAENESISLPERRDRI